MVTAVGVLAAATVIGLSACDALDRLLVVDVPGVVSADEVETPEGVPGLMAGLVGAFECALVRAIVAGGFIGNELTDASFTNFTFAGMIRRDPDRSAAPTSTATCDSWFGLYTPIQQARWLADRAIALLDGWTDNEVPNRRSHLATANAYSGYSHILLGELFCSAALDGGPQLTPFEVFARAEARFTAAMEHAAAAGNQDMLNMAQVGRARVRLNMGNTSGALEDARAVPDGFVVHAQYSDQSWRTRNVFYHQNVDGDNFTVEVPFRNLEWQGVPDPRVRVIDRGMTGSDGTTPLWSQAKYTSPSSPIPIARWAEAQLIIAEIEGGQVAVDIINELHARAGLPPFESTDPEEIRAHVIQERQRELFLEGQHMYNDMIRLGVPMFPEPGAEFKPPSATFYGAQLCQPLPTVETDNNPNIGDADVIWDTVRG